MRHPIILNNHFTVLKVEIDLSPIYIDSSVKAVTQIGQQ